MLIPRAILLVVSTVLIIFYIVLLWKGSRYDSLIGNLDNKTYSDKELYSAGFELQKFPLLSMNSGTGEQLMRQSLLLHPEQEGRFAEYWARITLARSVSLSFLVLAAALCFGALSDSPMMMIMGVVFGLVGAWAVYDNGIHSMDRELKQRSDDCVYEFANMVSKLCLLMNCNLTIHDAWGMVANSNNGTIYQLMKIAFSEMNSGTDDVKAIHEFGVRCGAPEIRKFSGTLIQSIVKGGSNITVFLRNQSKELAGQRKQMLLRRGDEAAAKLLFPTMLIMGGIILIIISAAAGNMKTGF